MNAIERFQPKTLAELKDVSEVLFRSGYFVDVTDAAKAMVKIMFGSELGLGPMTSMQGIMIIKGKPSLSANTQAALVKSSKRYDYRLRTNTNAEVSIEFFQGDGQKWESLGISTFTLEDGKKAGTQNLDRFPRNMLFARAMSNGVKWFCPDLTNAPIYTPEELGAVVGEDGEAVVEGTYGEVLMANGSTDKKPPVVVSVGEHGERVETEVVEMATSAQLSEMDLLGNLLYGDNWPAKRTQIINAATRDSTQDLTAQAADVIIKGIQKRLPLPDVSLTTPVVQATLIDVQPVDISDGPIYP